MLKHLQFLTAICMDPLSEYFSFHGNVPHWMFSVEECFIMSTKLKHLSPSQMHFYLKTFLQLRLI